MTILYVLVYHYTMTNKTVRKTQLFEAFANLSSTKEAEAFCFDVMTPQEVEAFADRLEVARQLSLGSSQRKVSADTGVSIATVTRVNRFLKRGAGGYKSILSKLSDLHSHSPNGTSAVARV